ncbi:hypothetical protein RHGRI_034332 [Rhododendron griersonianum]|uniref:Uncharacterized protein n=1 Tax=Rhododendron griersonianum TaxID=479676 RepID=A0AAV6I313_9ERIC|nr:hypothetical protein RHGRI_034332 [Rhododendron griersonianum]
MEFQAVWDFTDDDPVGGVLLRRSLCISIADLFMHRTPVTKLQSFDPLFLSACLPRPQKCYGCFALLLAPKRRPGEESDADSSRETSSDGGSECGAERGTNHAQGAWSQRNNMHAIAQSFNRLSVDKGEISDPPGFLLFEYFDSAPPFSREPLADKASRFLFP